MLRARSKDLLSCTRMQPTFVQECVRAGAKLNVFAPCNCLKLNNIAVVALLQVLLKGVSGGTQAAAQGAVLQAATSSYPSASNSTVTQHADR
jgi:hypothetical protein